MPVGTVNNLLSDIIDTLKNNILETQASQGEIINNCFSEIHKIDDIVSIITQDETLSLIKEAQCDLLNSVLFASQGFYRNAHICLRSALELTLSFIYYYDHHYDYILWKSDHLDTSWTRITDRDKGIFNSKFYQLLLNDCINIENLIVKATKTYHLCSQSVHGKFEYMQTIVSPYIKYDLTAFTSYFELFKDCSELIKAFIYLRFKNKASQLDLDSIRELDALLKHYEVLR